MDERKRHYRKIRISYPTPSREGIVVSIVQLQDALGNWQSPTVTFSQALPQIIEDEEFLHELGRAITVASYFFDQMVSYIDNDDARTDERRQGRDE